jgi:ParB family transcriptional regulator, chromosome partitioning protein
VSRPVSSRLAGAAAPTRARRNQQSAVNQPADLRQIPLDRIDLPRRPARRFLGDIPALADSIQQYGLQQPISVREEKRRFQLTSGLRRFQAATMLGWTTIPAFVRNVSADDAYLVDLVENLQREDLSPEEEADALGELVRARGWTLEQVAAGIKRSVGYVSKRVRVFEDPVLREAVSQRGLAVSTAEELLAIDPENRAAAVERAVAERWDQTLAREAVEREDPARTTFSQVGRIVEIASGVAAQRKTANLATTSSRGAPASRELSERRPPGFTRAVREFHRMIMAISIDDLSQADRAALRALFRDLVMLARATANRKQPVFPPLPPAARVTSTARGAKRTAAHRSR